MAIAVQDLQANQRRSRRDTVATAVRVVAGPANDAGNVRPVPEVVYRKIRRPDIRVLVAGEILEERHRGGGSAAGIDEEVVVHPADARVDDHDPDTAAGDAVVGLR